ncbi:type I restriction endonuclease subunit R [Nocardioides xinjiangensis]|uniref:type I restriction endonuclease subunit R n=1 Tax=Nocardioides xinjiangensis TaxID=2817376 RepID=UPI001B30FF5B|nr:type I restriction endonuclease subunit R [Nocardioides sp. SYSU D00778]
MVGMTEDGLEQLVIEWLRELGWEYAFGPDIAPEMPGAERTDYREVVLEQRLNAAIGDLNPSLPGPAIAGVVTAVKRAQSPLVESENWNAYRLLVDGVAVEYRGADGSLRATRARLVNWEEPEKNDLLVVNQFTIQGEKKERRPDVICFVNGLPLALFELKRPGKTYAKLSGAWNQVRTYRDQIPDVFKWNQLVVLSDGIQARAGSFSAAWEHYAPWKTINGQDLASGAMPQIEVLVKGIFEPEVFFDLCRNFIATFGDGEKTVKKVAKYHQYWAVRKAVAATIDAIKGDGRIGVVWHTQGSGKSLEMEYFTGKVMRHKDMANPTVVVVTDRNDLDDQLFEETFAASKIGSPLPEAPVKAEDRDDLKALLTGRQSGGIIFTTIQKFGISQADRDAGRKFPLLSDRRNIVVMVDEAHRSNYDLIDGFARHLRDGLPNASYIGFTGTPIESKDRSTKAVFGDYIDTYDMTQATQDGATVKVYYEPRLAKVQLPEDTREELDDEFADAIVGAEEEVGERLKSKWAKVEAIVGSEDRIKELAADIVEHWEGRREVLAGKAMIVTMSRRIAVALYQEIVALRPEWHSDDDADGVIKVVMTGNATDPAEFQPHIRNKRDRNAIKERATNPHDKLELVIVRDMWLTGFDSPPMHTMYVDKPMRGASLMQAITRVNRTFRDKPSGLVVDYIGIAEDLKDALSNYTKRDQANEEVGEDVYARVVPALLAEHSVCSDLLHGIDWVTILGSGGDRAWLNAVAATVNHLLEFEPDELPDPDSDGEFARDPGDDEPSIKKRFMAHARRLVTLFATVPTSPQATQIRDDVAFFDAVRASIAKIEGSDAPGGDADAALDTAVRQVVSSHIAGTGVIDIYAEAGMERPDISLIDDDFMERFGRSQQKNLQLEALKRLLSQEVKSIGRRNIVTGKKFSEMLTASLLRYQNRSLDTATVVAELVELAKALRAEKERGDNSGLTTDELAFYDALCDNVTAVETMPDDTMKKIAHELTEIVRRDAKTDWNVKEQVRANLRATIKRLLRKYGYPPEPDYYATATDLILRQAEVIADGAA